ncbi:MAG TPA: cysteine hydrolase [Solirubrobacterales bacterium]|nr:cysteine hydrolase [Solirubrobacterales bacterium]
MGNTNKALLMLDFQEGICRPDGALGAAMGTGDQVVERGTLEAAARCLAAARESGVAVVHSRVGFEPGYVNRTNRSAAFAGFEENGIMGLDSADAAICPEVAAGEGEPVLARGWVDPFLNTPLAAILHAHRVAAVYMGGVATNFVVESAARHAGDLGFEVIVVDEMSASLSAEMHSFSIENLIPSFGRVAGVDEAVAELGR